MTSNSSSKLRDLYPCTMLRHNSLHFYQNLLQESVETKECIHDLIAILRVIPVTRVKDFVKQEINGSDLQFCRKMYYAQTSFDEIFSSDIIQSILAFGGLYHTKAVSTKWEQYSEQNEQNHLEKLYKEYLHYDQNINKTYIIDANRTKLHKMEIELGYKGPLRDIGLTLGICKSGDRILVPDGVHDSSQITINSAIQLIGVGAAVTIKSPFKIIIQKKCYIRNISFDCSGFLGSDGVGVVVKDNATLSMENCAVSVKFCDHHLGIWAMNGSHLNVENCTFVGCYGIDLSPFAKEANINNCTFKCCGIKITDQYEVAVNGEMVQLKCTKNMFDIGIYSLDDFHPIAYSRDPGYDDYSLRSDRYTLKYNLAKGTFQKLYALKDNLLYELK